MIILEKYLTGLKQYSHLDTVYDVYLNPTPHELYDLLVNFPFNQNINGKWKKHNSLRFILLKTPQKINTYLFSSKLLHEKVMAYLKQPYPYNTSALCGLVGNEYDPNQRFFVAKEAYYSLFTLDELLKKKDFLAVKKIVDQDWSNKYIDVEPALNYYRKKIKNKKFVS